MKNKMIAMVVCVLMILGIMPISAFASSNDDIIILYENDAHCVVEGYSKLAAMKKELQQTHDYVGVVSGGDYIQGNSLGAISEGEYMVNLMNLVGYDAVTLGNHEFDYRIENLEELIGKMDTKPICCNFQKIGEDAPVFKPYSIVSYGEIDVAYIGITTPSTLTKSSPAQFKDENGNFIYTFHQTDLYDVVQDYIDSAKEEGADYVIALSHIGYADDAIY
jgi:2',3'-cyclic-nucleotide 2'-phosphodiesterase (5'-nucleotidase family)